MAALPRPSAVSIRIAEAYSLRAYLIRIVKLKMQIPESYLPSAWMPGTSPGMTVRGHLGALLADCLEQHRFLRRGNATSAEIMYSGDVARQVESPPEIFPSHLPETVLYRHPRVAGGEHGAPAH